MKRRLAHLPIAYPRVYAVAVEQHSHYILLVGE
jgi:hypothetical protein